MEDVKVSVIVPVYDVSKYLRRCLDSILVQSLGEIEVIIVNDASPDPLDDKICREYEEKDSRVTIWCTGATKVRVEPEIQGWL